MTRSVILWAIACLIFVAIVLVGTHTVMLRVFPSPKHGGEYGDMFGVADAVFSGLTLVAAFLALWFQGREVRASLTEIAHAQKEHRDAIELQGLASLIDAIDGAVQRGETQSYTFEGKTLSLTELRALLLDRLIGDYEQLGGGRHRVKR